MRLYVNCLQMIWIWSSFIYISELNKKLLRRGHNFETQIGYFKHITSFNFKEIWQKLVIYCLEIISAHNSRRLECIYVPYRGKKRVLVMFIIKTNIFFKTKHPYYGFYVQNCVHNSWCHRRGQLDLHEHMKRFE